MRIGWLAPEMGIPVSLGNAFPQIGVHIASVRPEVEWLEYSFQNFDRLVERRSKFAKVRPNSRAAVLFLRKKHGVKGQDLYA